MERINSKLLNWASILDPKTKAQAIETSRMDIIYPHLALMPDAHLGMGATVGSVIPTEGAIMPSAIGVDIGCGMDAVLTPYIRTDLDASRLQDLHAAISAAVPLSAGARNQKVTGTAAVRVARLERMDGYLQAEDVLPGWRNQLGTLGSGNHFIEVSLDEIDRVWLFLHSGSRGVGNKLAQRHIRVAKDYCRAEGISLPNQDLAYLREGTEEFDSYIQALRWAQEFARLNRAEMMDRVVDCLARWMGVEQVQRLQGISCHHNYTEYEIHEGRGVWLSRKGAISALPGLLGLIPGSMGTRSYVVEGRGNRDSLNSAPHGAGRMYSRSAAKERFTREDLDLAMKDAGVVWGNSDAFIDEIPGAYKDIDVVMRDAADLVEVQHELRQILNCKGN